MEEKKEKKDKIIAWLKKPSNLLLLAILILAFGIRLYYFIMTKTQPLWWDEAAYGGIAKSFIYLIWEGTYGLVREMEIRPLLFPLIWSILMRLGLGEVTIKFLLEFIPSVLTVFFVYLIGKELYGRKVGLIAAFIYSVFWLHLFYSLRFLVHIPALALLFLSIYYFIKSQKNKFNFKYFAISLFLLSIATLIRYTKGLVFFVYLIILLLNKRWVLLKKSKFWIYSLIGLVPLLLFFLYNLLTVGNIFPALFAPDYVAPEYVSAKPFAFSLLNYIPIYLGIIFFIFFLLGIAIILLDIFLGYNLIIKSKKIKNHIFLLLLLIVFYAFFIFYLRGAEDRWLFVTSLPLALFSGLGIITAYKFIKKYSKVLAVILICSVLFFGAYQQLDVADPLIKNKKESFLQVRQGFEWMKENTPKDTIIFTYGGEVYAMYYSERRYEIFPPDAIGVENFNATYAILHAFNPPSEEVNTYFQENQDKWQPINAYFFDIERTMPALIIYKKVK